MDRKTRRTKQLESELKRLNNKLVNMQNRIAQIEDELLEEVLENDPEDQE